MEELPSGSRRKNYRRIEGLSEEVRYNVQNYPKLYHVHGGRSRCTQIDSDQNFCSVTRHLPECTFGVSQHQRRKLNQNLIRNHENSIIRNTPETTYELTVNLHMATHENREAVQMHGYMQHQENISKKKAKKCLYNFNQNNRTENDPNLPPPDLVKITKYIGPNVTREEKFIWNFEDMCLFMFPSELLRFQNGRAHIDGTFSYTNLNDEFNQIFIWSFKHEIDDKKVCMMPVIICTLKNKKLGTYSTMIRRIKQIYSENFPSLPPLQLRQFSSDFEAGIIRSFTEEFPGVQPLLCLFHFSQSVKNAINKISGKYKQVPPLLYVKHLTKALFYMPFCNYPFLVDTFFLHLIFIKNNFLDENYHSNFDDFFNYLYANYFTTGHFKSYQNWNWNTLIVDENEMDLTNNGSECINRTFNSDCTSGKKTFHDLCHKIVKFKKKYYEDKSIDELANNNVQVSRSDKFIWKKQAIRNYLESFELLSDQLKSENLIRTMHAINNVPSVGPLQSLNQIIENNENFYLDFH